MLNGNGAAFGEMAEWSNAAVLKTVDLVRGPGVRIPLSPHYMIVSGCSTVRLARLLWEQEVPGSNPGTPTK